MVILYTDHSYYEIEFNSINTMHQQMAGMMV